MALFVAGCATPKSSPGPATGPLSPIPAPSDAWSALPGWRDDDHAAAFAAFASVCGISVNPDLARVCREARTRSGLDEAQARAFFEANFRPELLPDVGTLTAYFAPEYQASQFPQGDFTAPLRQKPAGAGPFPDRATIEAWPTAGALAWLRPEELFLLQVQGSGVLDFPDGRRMKAAVTATNGLPFTGIARPMQAQGLLAPGDTSAEAIRVWLEAHRGPAADAIMRLNPRYAFFRLSPDDGNPPVGAGGVPLPAGRAAAVDPAFHAMGDLMWIDADQPALAGARPKYQRVVMALDVGGAIKGAVRADLFLGQGPGAGLEAGRVRHNLRLYRLVPLAWTSPP